MAINCFCQPMLKSQKIIVCIHSLKFPAYIKILYSVRKLKIGAATFASAHYKNERSLELEIEENVLLFSGR